MQQTKKYTVKGVSNNTKMWDSKFGPMKTYLVALNEWEKPVKLNQKATSPAPKAGDELFGKIEEDTYDGGYKFKKEQTPFVKSEGGGRSKTNDESMYRTSALKNATEFSMGDKDPQKVVQTAQVFYEWLTGNKPEAKPEQAPPPSDDDFPEDINLDEVDFGD